MSDPEKTDTNWRTRGAKALAWAQAHQVITAVLVGFALGFVAGKL